MTTILSFIVVIGIIVFVHEFGHFIAAKLSGVRVEIFSLGFPPKMIGKKIGETEYQIAWIPLGGFVKMSGMIDESFDEDFDPNDPRTFVAQPLPKRIFIITAGVLMNFLLGFLIYSMVTWSEGTGTIKGTVISDVAKESPAYEAGIRPGDEITEIGGQTLDEWESLTNIVREHPNKPINVKWKSEGGVESALITPEAKPIMNIETGERDTVGQLGIVGTLEMEPVGFFTALTYGAAQTAGVLHLNVISIKWLVTGKAKIRDLSGPIGIAKMSGDSARSGLSTFVVFIAYISISIGFLNILPIPMLDGGHLVFMLVEAVIRKPIPIKLKMNLMKIGLAALLALILIVSYHDILRFFISK